MWFFMFLSQLAVHPHWSHLEMLGVCEQCKEKKDLEIHWLHNNLFYALLNVLHWKVPCYNRSISTFHTFYRVQVEWEYQVLRFEESAQMYSDNLSGQSGHNYSVWWIWLPNFSPPNFSLPFFSLPKFFTTELFSLPNFFTTKNFHHRIFSPTNIFTT